MCKPPKCSLKFSEQKVSRWQTLPSNTPLKNNKLCWLLLQQAKKYNRPQWELLGKTKPAKYPKSNCNFPFPSLSSWLQSNLNTKNSTPFTKITLCRTKSSINSMPCWRFPKASEPKTTSKKLVHSFLQSATSNVGLSLRFKTLSWFMARQRSHFLRTGKW